MQETHHQFNAKVVDSVVLFTDERSGARLVRETVFPGNKSRLTYQPTPHTNVHLLPGQYEGLQFHVYGPMGGKIVEFNGKGMLMSLSIQLAETVHAAFERRRMEVETDLQMALFQAVMGIAPDFSITNFPLDKNGTIEAGGDIKTFKLDWCTDGSFKHRYNSRFFPGISIELVTMPDESGINLYYQNEALTTVRSGRSIPTDHMDRGNPGSKFLADAYKAIDLSL